MTLITENNDRREGSIQHEIVSFRPPGLCELNEEIEKKDGLSF